MITLSMKFVIAFKSTKALVCTFLLYIQSVTGILKEVILLCACYESPKKEIVSHVFKYLICNLKLYNGVEI